MKTSACRNLTSQTKPKGVMLTSEYMGKMRPAVVGFWIMSVAAIAISVASIVVLWPTLLSSAHSESASLISEANKSRGGEAQSDYQLATWLNPDYNVAYADLASAELVDGQPGQALINLTKAGTSIKTTSTKVQALMEVGDNNDAAQAASALTFASATDQDLVLASLAYSSDDQESRVSTLLPRISSPEALHAAKRAQAGKLPLAAQLYAAGLLNSSKQLLINLPASYERNLTLSQIDYDNPTRSNLAKAEELLLNAIALNPASTQSRQLLVKIYRAENKTTLADMQIALINKLQSGRP
jgi:hypothetical protein